MDGSNEIFHDRTNFPSAEYLHINSCGINRYNINRVKQLRIFRPNGRVDVHILFVTAGAWTAVFDGVTYTVHEGEGALYLPNVPHDYAVAVEPEQPRPESYWLHFCGTATGEVLRAAGLIKSGVLRPAVPAEVRRVFDSLLRAYLNDDPITANGNVLRLLAQLSPQRAAPASDSIRRIRAEMEYIGTHYTEPLQLEKCAARCCLSLSRFSHLFTSAAGISPYQYQLRLRLDQAQELLAYSSLSVAEIAEQLGFGDALYFSRLFRHTCGCSPSKFRAARRK